MQFENPTIRLHCTWFVAELSSRIVVSQLSNAMKNAEPIVSKMSSLKPTSEVDFKGHWINELKSYMDLTISGTSLTGSYVSAVSKTDEPTKPFDLLGTVAGDMISFTVNWGNSITTWIGHGVIEGGKPEILTLWHLVVAIPNETDPEVQWKTVLAGADTFRRA